MENVLVMLMLMPMMFPVFLVVLYCRRIFSARRQNNGVQNKGQQNQADQFFHNGQLVPTAQYRQSSRERENG